MRSEPIRLRSETRHAITERISRKHGLDQTVFDAAQAEVENFLRATAYPAFLKSDVYVDFLQTALEGRIDKTLMLDPSASGCLEKSPNLTECPNLPMGGKTLPTLDEDRELQSEELLCVTSSGQQHLCDPHICRIPCTMTNPIFQPHSHCQHCMQCHSQGVFNPCEQAACFSHFPHGFRPPSSWSYQTVAQFPTAVPLRVENVQMTRFYRAELSLQQQSQQQLYPNLACSRIAAPKTSHEMAVSGYHTHQSRATNWRHPTRPNYVYTHWVDATCPPSIEPRMINYMPSQPPNPYHISYAPVSARDSEHHSLSSEARTDDTHSHTDSSHDDAANRMSRPAGLSHRYSSPFQLTRSHHKPHMPQVSQSQRNPTHYSTQCVTIRDASADCQYQSREPTQTRVASVPAGDEVHGHVDPSDSMRKFQRRSTRRLATNNRGSKHSNPTSGAADLPTITTHTNVKPVKSTNRSYNLAEHDPPEFARILSEKLQRLLDNQLVSERIDHLMTESSPNPPEITDQQPPSESNPTTVSVPTSVTGNVQRTNGVGSSATCSTVSSVLQRPWVDRLLAAARAAQHDNTRDNAQAILEDHCSRIWAASADRTPTSSGSGSGGVHVTKNQSVNSTTHSKEPALNLSPQLDISQKLIGTNTSREQDIATQSYLEQSAYTTKHGDPRQQRKTSHEQFSQISCSKPIDWMGKAISPTGICPTISPPWFANFKHPLDTTFDEKLTEHISTQQIDDDNNRHELLRDDMAQICSHVIQTPVTTVQELLNLSATTTVTSHSTQSTSNSACVSTSTSNSTPGNSALSSYSTSLVIGYYMGDDPVPYRSLWHSSEITLGQFKQLIPKKKGQFRYFFKKASDEFDSGVVHQEITNDDTLLPLWDGKVVAKVERVDY